MSAESDGALPPEITTVKEGRDLDRILDHVMGINGYQVDLGRHVPDPPSLTSLVDDGPPPAPPRHVTELETSQQATGLELDEQQPTTRRQRRELEQRLGRHAAVRVMTEQEERDHLDAMRRRREAAPPGSRMARRLAEQQRDELPDAATPSTSQE